MLGNNLANYSFTAGSSLISSAQIDSELRIPRVTTNPTVALSGDLVYNTAQSKFYIYDGAAWVEVTTGGAVTGYVPYTGATQTINIPAARRFEIGTSVSASAGIATVADANNSVTIAPASVAASAGTAQTVKFSLASAATGAGKSWDISHTQGQTSLKIVNVNNASSVPLMIDADDAVFMNKVNIGNTVSFNDGDLIVDTSGPTYFICCNGDDPNASNRFFISCYNNTFVELGCFSADPAGTGWKNMILNSGGGFVGVGTTTPQAMIHATGAIRTDDVVYAFNGSATVPSFSFISSTTTGMYYAGTNTIGFTAAGVRLISASQSAIAIEPTGTSAFRVSTNTGGHDALVISSTGTNTADANTIAWSAVMQPASGGRLVLPQSITLPGAPTNAEIYLENNGANVLTPKFYDASGWNRLAVLSANNTYKAITSPFTTAMATAAQSFTVVVGGGGTTFTVGGSYNGAGMNPPSIASSNPLEITLNMTPFGTMVMYADLRVTTNNFNVALIYHTQFVTDPSGATTSIAAKVFKADGTELNATDLAPGAVLSLNAFMMGY